MHLSLKSDNSMVQWTVIQNLQPLKAASFVTFCSHGFELEAVNEWNSTKYTFVPYFRLKNEVLLS